MELDARSRRLVQKTSLQRLQVELQEGYGLSRVEALALARRVQDLVDECTGLARQPGQITYQAIALDEPPGKPLRVCRKVPVHLTVVGEGDAQTWGHKGAHALRQLRIQRLIYEALMQGGALSQEDLSCILGVSQRTVKRVFARFRQQGQALPSRGEIQDMGRGVSHKVPVIRRYVQDVSLTRISRSLGRHGIESMARYLRHFALVMILTDRGLTPGQMQSVIGISENLASEYQGLYGELDVPEYQRVLSRLRQMVFQPSTATEAPLVLAEPRTETAKKGGTG
jgi:hypothetical protein